MEQIESSLRNYRLRKRRQEKINQVKKCIKKVFMIGGKIGNEQTDSTSLVMHDSESEEYLSRSVSNSHDSNESIDDEVLPSDNKEKLKAHADSKDIYLQYILCFVYIAFWITLYIIAIELQFGIVYLMVSALFGIYFNTRTSTKKPNEISAYSVFNNNCESIDGTLKAEQFEREMGLK